MDVGAELERHWGLVAGQQVPLTGGMNSRTWRVRVGGTGYVLKSVPAGAAAALRNGMALAAHLARAGFASGAPVPALDGGYVVAAGDRAAVLLAWVPGRPLTADDQALVGETLGRVHRALRGAPAPQPFPWLDPDAPHLALEPWLAPAIRTALSGYAAVGPLTVGALHADPAPEAFRLAESGCGLIDWASAHRGPLLYDLASAVMYVGGTARAGALLDAYRGTGALDAAEIDRGLAALLRLRWAVQADYFARRTANHDLTGIDGPEGNAAGLADARTALTS